MERTTRLIISITLCFISTGILHASDPSYDTLLYQNQLIEAKKQIMLEREDLAEELLKECLRMNPNSAIANYELANIYIGQNKMGEALSHAKKAVSLRQGNIWYHWLLARLYQYMGNLDKTEDAYEEMIDRFPKQIDVYYEYAAILTSAGEYDDAIDIYQDAEGITGPSEIVAYEIYSLHKLSGDREEAKEQLQHLIDNYPEPDYQRELANLYIEEGDEKKAIEVFKNILKTKPNDGKTNMILADYYREREMMELSFVHLKKAFESQDIEMERKLNLLMSMLSFIDEDPEMKEAAYDLVRILSDTYPSEAKVAGIYADLLRKEGKFGEAIGQLRIALERDKSNYQVWKQLLYLQHAEGRFDSLLASASMAVDLFPNQPMFYLYKGLAQSHKGLYTQAEHSLNDGLSITLSSNKMLKGEFYAQLGYVYHQNGKHEKSDDAFENALKIDPTNITALNNYAYYLAERGIHLEKATDMSKQTLRAEPMNPSFLDTYAWILYKNGKYEAALKNIQKAYEQNKSAAIVEHFGDILFKNGAKSKAMEKWKEAAEEYETIPADLQKKIETGQLPE